MIRWLTWGTTLVWQGNDIIIDTQTGGSWFPLFPDANAYAGPDSFVLIGQFTTDNSPVSTAW